MRIGTANYPWVFWINISYRPKWFKMFWKTRGANYIEYQVLILKITIGRPWFKGSVDAHHTRPEPTISSPDAGEKQRQ